MDPNAEIMRKAIELATANALSGAGGPFGALILRDGLLIASGVNQVTASKDPTAHAEVVAIRAACQKLETFDLTGCEIYSSCEPCPMCLAAILWARLSTLYFASTADDAAAAGFDDSHFYREIAKPFAQRELPTTNLLREAGQESFRAWQQLASKVKY